MCLKGTINIGDLDNAIRDELAAIERDAEAREIERCEEFGDLRRAWKATGIQDVWNENARIGRRFGE